VLHADDHLEKAGRGQFTIKAGQARLLIDPTIDPNINPGIEQANERPAAKENQNAIQATIETNTLTAPGPPGAVDKGERQARGQKLLLSTPAPVTRARSSCAWALNESI